MKILFVHVSSLRFTVATPDTDPLGGTESAVCYLARHLAAMGHNVALVAHQPEGGAEPEPKDILGVRHLPPTVLLNGEFLASQAFDAILVGNTSVAGPPLRAMAPNAYLLLWNHLAPDHANVGALRQPVVTDSFDGIVYVSDWQRRATEQAFNVTKPSAIIGNGFAPAFENLFASAAELQSAKQNRAAYTTTPFRGLNILLDAMRGLDADTKLDLYSSMKVYQSTADDQYAALYAYAAQNPAITCHGAVAQNELAERLRPVAFFTYPSTYAETFCIAALEARAAGLKVLTTATAALPEVLGSAADYVGVSLGQPEKLIADFRAMLRGNADRFLAHPHAWAEERFADLQRVNREYSWAARAKAWERLLETRDLR